ncbi:MAG TPA: hypothetical protein VFU30_01895 [Gaiellaceae bacterium]|nr:hypothetical protein [Gaiellaceae bacterium]
MAETVHQTPWTFPGGSADPGQSVKGYAVAEAGAGHLGTVLWATYRPGKSYLVVRHGEAPDGAHVIVPAGAVERVDHERRVVTLHAAVARGQAAPSGPGLLDGFAWLYTDV